MGPLKGLLIGLLLVVAVLACSSGQHRKVSGPPPEYELPDQPDAGGFRDAGGAKVGS